MSEQTPKWNHVKALKTVVTSENYPVAQYVDFKNGRLIAAAPEMLEMLEILLANKHGLPLASYSFEIKALIAKAKGEA